jgi:hypothetical protein
MRPSQIEKNIVPIKRGWESLPSFCIRRERMSERVKFPPEKWKVGKEQIEPLHNPNQKVPIAKTFQYKPTKMKKGFQKGYCTVVSHAVNWPFKQSKVGLLNKVEWVEGLYLCFNKTKQVWKQ